MGFVPEPGLVVSGKYRLERPLGKGGMAVVFAATHLDLGRAVALKFILAPPGVDTGELRQRFMREAQATFALRSEHIVRLLDLGQIGDDGLFIAMELLEGKNFQELIADRRRFTEAEVLLFAKQICEGLEEAHARGIIHRDLKPANLYLTATATGKASVKILDFGIAKRLLDDHDEPITHIENPLGTPKYMAPEQWQEAGAVDERADLYAVGVILFELLAGKVPHQDLPVAERLRRTMGSAVPSVKALRPDVSDAFARIIARCLRPHPEERFRSAHELSAALAVATASPAGRGAKPPGPLAMRATEDNEATALVDLDSIAPPTSRDPILLLSAGGATREEPESVPLPLLKPIRSSRHDLDGTDVEFDESLGPVVPAASTAAKPAPPDEAGGSSERTAVLFLIFALVLLGGVVALAFRR